MKDRNIIEYFCVVCITLLIFWSLYNQADLSQPLAYDGDTIPEYSMIKSMMNTGSWMSDERLGNGTYNIFEHNTGNLLDYVIIKVICGFTDNVFLVSNIYYVLCILLASIVAYFVMRKVGITEIIAGVFAILYAFTPYAQLRCIFGGHLIWLGCYYIIPLCFLVCMAVRKYCSIKNLYIYFLIAIIGLSNIYYIFFFGIFFTICSLRQISEERDKSCIILAIKRLFALGCAVAINFLPSICYYIQNAGNIGGGGPFNRLPQMAENYGLKVTSLFLPRLNHRWKVLDNLHDVYMETTATNGEAEIASLGIIGAIGLIMIFLFFWLKIGKHNAVIDEIIILTLSAILIGTIGGLGSIIAYMIPMIRCYARISIFIAFFTLIFNAICLDDIYKKIKWKKVFSILMGGILVLGIWDQTVVYQGNTQQEIVSKKEAQQKFLDTFLDGKDGQKIYQYPGKAFPGTYDYMYWYVLDKLDTSWSSGGQIGREEAYWINRLEKLSTKEFLQQLALNEFDGILIDYLDSVSEYGSEKTEELLEELCSEMNVQPIFNDDRTYLYFPISDFYADAASKIATKMVYPIYKTDDASEFIDEEGERYRWMKKDSSIFLQNDSGSERMIVWNATFVPSANMIGQTVEIVVEGIQLETIRFEDNAEKTVCLPIFVKKDGATIELITDVDDTGMSFYDKAKLYQIKKDTYYEQE